MDVCQLAVVKVVIMSPQAPTLKTISVPSNDNALPGRDEHDFTLTWLPETKTMHMVEWKGQMDDNGFTTGPLTIRLSQWTEGQKEWKRVAQFHIKNEAGNVLFPTGNFTDDEYIVEVGTSRRTHYVFNHRGEQCREERTCNEDERVAGLVGYPRGIDYNTCYVGPNSIAEISVWYENEAGGQYTVQHYCPGRLMGLSTPLLELKSQQPVEVHAALDGRYVLSQLWSDGGIGRTRFWFIRTEDLDEEPGYTVHLDLTTDEPYRGRIIGVGGKYFILRYVSNGVELWHWPRSGTWNLAASLPYDPKYRAIGSDRACRYTNLMAADNESPTIIVPLDYEHLEPLAILDGGVFCSGTVAGPSSVEEGVTLNYCIADTELVLPLVEPLNAQTRLDLVSEQIPWDHDGFAQAMDKFVEAMASCMPAYWMSWLKALPVEKRAEVMRSIRA